MKWRRSRQGKRGPAKAKIPRGSRAGDGSGFAGPWSIVALSGLTYLLSLPMFEPSSIWPLGYVVFVPWLVAVCTSKRAGRVYFASYLLGAVFFLTQWRWLYGTSPTALIGSCLLVLAPEFPLAAWLTRHLYRRRGLSLTVVFPIVWTAIESVRSWGPQGFPWFLLGHTQVRVLTMIQIADVVGALGVGFVVAMMNGWLADMLLRFVALKRKGPRQLLRDRAGISVTMLLVLGASLLYGRIRLADRQTVDGPRISILQGDYPMSPDMDLNARVGNVTPNDGDRIDRLLRKSYDAQEADKRLGYIDLIRTAAADSPDLIVLPETPWSLFLNGELREANPESYYSLQHEEFVRLAARYSASMVVGGISQEPQPPGSYPGFHRYNSAFVYTPGAAEPAHYDKIHLVLFGEYLPFRYSKRLFWLYRWLNDSSWNPWGRGGREYSLTPGEEFLVFPVQADSLEGETFNFGVTICYEDAVPYVFRRFILDDRGNKRVDFMLNISNDGWFGRSGQQAQHLATCVFRAVENRVGIARAVNTGISGFIDPSGAWYGLAGSPDDARRAGGMGHRTAQVVIDPRVTVYSRHGDMIAMACLVLALIGLGDTMVLRLRSWRRGRGTPSG